MGFCLHWSSSHRRGAPPPRAANQLPVLELSLKVRAQFTVMTTSQAPTPELLALHRRYGQSRCTKLRNRLVEAHLLFSNGVKVCEAKKGMRADGNWQLPATLIKLQGA